MLMAVGMTSVFVVLVIVIYLGKGMIAFVNRFFPENEALAVKKSDDDANHRLAIDAAVALITNGKGKVDSVEKI